MPLLYRGWPSPQFHKKHLWECMYVFTNSSTWVEYVTWSIFKWSLTGLNSEFSFSLTGCLSNTQEPILPYYLAEGRLVKFIPFSRVLALCEMQTVSSRIETCITMSIYYNDNHYIMTHSFGNACNSSDQLHPCKP